MIVNCHSCGLTYIDLTYMDSYIRTNINYSTHYLSASSKCFICLMTFNQIKTTFSRRDYGALFAVKL